MVSAFRARVRAVHPDANTGGGDPERVALLVRARSTLTGPAREAYADSLRAHRAKRTIEADRERREARQREREEVLAEAKRVLKQGMERARYRRARWGAGLPVMEDGVEVFPEEWDAAPTERDAHGHVEGSSRREAVDPTPDDREVDDDDYVRRARARTEELLHRGQARVEAEMARSRADVAASRQWTLDSIERQRRQTEAEMARTRANVAASHQRTLDSIERQRRQTLEAIERSRADVAAWHRHTRDDTEREVREWQAKIDHILGGYR